jgi:hypothetical protein
LNGAIGVGINQGATTAQWDTVDGTCDETCQRWVSACLLARTNAYGRHVEISMRAPANAPQPIKDALALSLSNPDEAAEFNKREGAYYGNLFLMQPASGVVGSPAVATPEFYACAGPESNIPSITYRFCSSQGDACPIETVGTCNHPTPQYNVCDDAPVGVGGVSNCRTALGGSDLRNEVITVYLRDPISVCGNAICEADEDSNICESDCHPDTWAKSIDMLGDADSYNKAWGQRLAVGPDDSTTIVGIDFNPVDFGGGDIGGATNIDSVNYIAHFKPDGTWAWSFRLPVADMSSVLAVIADPSGNLFALGNKVVNNLSDVTLSKYTSAGVKLWTKFIGSPTASEAPTADGLAVDGAGNVYVGGLFSANYDNTDHSAATTNLGGADLTSAGRQDAFVAKFDANGNHVWSTRFGDANDEWGVTVAANSTGEVAVRIQNSPCNNFYGPQYLHRLSSGGVELWSKSSLVLSQGVDGNYNVPCSGQGTPTRIEGTAIADDGSVYITGMRAGTSDFGTGPVSPPPAGYGNYVAKYDAAGNFSWQQSSDGGGQTFTLRLDAAENVLAIGLAYSGNYGAGPIDSEGYQDPVMVLYSPEGVFRWSRTLRSALNGQIDDLQFDSSGNVRVRGYFDGSIVLDNQLLVNSIPELTLHGDLYLGKFKEPCSTAACDTTAPLMSNVPAPITKEATGFGTEVRFNKPTALDNLPDGTSVTCSPASKTLFQIGTTNVTCTAYDVHGNHSAVTFPVTVTNKGKPVMIVPDDIVVTATGPLTPVNYTVTATDQVSGNRPVTCTPTSGSSFSVGTTNVNCSANDGAGNSVTGLFHVIVNPPAGISWSGVLQPINADGSSIFKLGSTVAVKFQLTGAWAGVTNLHAEISTALLTNNTPGSVNEPTSNAAPDNGNTFRYDATSGQYIYNLSTKGAPWAVGKWRVYIDLGDGNSNYVDISLK